MQVTLYNSYMTATGHALIGTIIAAKFNNPYLAVPLSFVSHFAFDVLPHWDPGTHHREKTKRRLFYEATADVLVGFVASYFLYIMITAEANFLLLYACVIAAQLPDWITAPYFILNIKHPLVAWSKWTYKIQHVLNNRLENPFWGVMTQIGAVVATYILLFEMF